MKKLLAMIISIIMVSCLVACGGGADSSASTPPSQEQPSSVVSESQPAEDSAASSEEGEEIVYLESTDLPESWQGEWVCTYSEANYFAERETIAVKDYDNAFLFTETVGDATYEENRWFCYDEENQVVHIFNEPPPFDEMWIRESFEIKKADDSELVLNRVGVGQEVRFERVSE